MVKEYLFDSLNFERNYDQINFKLSGWAVILQSEGRQERHIHPDSLVSGVLYLKTPVKTKNYLVFCFHL